MPAFKKLLKTCIAFANGYGGRLVIGVDDDLTVIGVSETDKARVYDELPNSLYDAISPGLLVEIYEQRLDDKAVMIVDVPQSMKKPVFLKEEGMPKGVYLRAGSSTRRATEAYVEALLRESKRIHFDEEAIHADITVLSQETIKNLFTRMDRRKLEAEKVICRSAINAASYQPTVAGVLCFCDSPQAYLPEAMVLCTRFKGTSGRNILVTEEIQGNLDQQIEQTFSLIKGWLISRYELVGAKLKVQTLVPEIALREAIVNAVLHRKYWIPGAVKIALFDDRLEIFNPGNFPGLVDTKHLGDGTTYLRNPTIARLMRRFGLIEKLGTGIRLMQESCAQVGLAAPEFIDGADSVKVVFRFLPSDHNNASEQDKLLALFEMRATISIKEVEQYLSVSRNTATRKLNQLVEAGKIVRIGKGPSVRYVSRER